ncbi:unnamed protein product [Schistosoma curassoni]|uniref:Uncharacterized protein n=1 Tax=Schistosoma curassoni TaxID=6186 RepID=A0A183JPC1_9TREM|nr:unnamed protein product [Schistosoma curassoni]
MKFQCLLLHQDLRLVQYKVSVWKFVTFSRPSR